MVIWGAHGHPISPPDICRWCSPGRTGFPLLALSGQPDRTRICLLSDQNGQRWIFGLEQFVHYRSEITKPLRSAATISPACRPASVSTAPFWLVNTIPPAPGPTAMPAPAAP